MVLIEVALGPHLEKLSSGYIIYFKRHKLPSELACLHHLMPERSQLIPGFLLSSSQLAGTDITVDVHFLEEH